MNAWFVEKRNPDTGEYPDFPDPDDGGSRAILNPPPPSLASLLEDAAGDGKGKGKDGKVRGRCVCLGSGGVEWLGGWVGGWWARRGPQLPCAAGEWAVQMRRTLTRGR